MITTTGKRTGIMECSPTFYTWRSLPAIASLATLALLLAPVCRADLKFTPTAGISETYTDNALLSSDDMAKSEFITELIPGFTLEDNSPSLKLNANYQFQYFEYSDKSVNGLNQSNSQLQANAKADLVKELLYIDSNASINQQSLSAFGPQVNNQNGYASANHTEVKTYNISPYLTHNFGATATAELRYDYNFVNSGNAALGNDQGDTILFNLASGPTFQVLGWGLQYNHQNVESTLAPTLISETTSGNLSYRISSTFSLTASGGHDDFSQGIGDTFKGSFWLTGFSWEPTARTSLEASAGKQFSGSDYSLAAKLHSRHSVWTVNYSDTVTSSLSQLTSPGTINTASLLTQLGSATNSDPASLQQAASTYMGNAGIPSSLATSVNLFNNSFFLQKQLQASVAFNTARSTLIFSLFDTTSTTLFATQLSNSLVGNNNAILNDNVKQIGGSAMLNWQISSRSNVFLNSTYAKVDSLSTDLTTINRAVTLGINRQISNRVNSSLAVRRDEGAAVNGGTYRENAVTATLSMKL